MNEQRAPVQGTGNYYFPVGHSARRPNAKPPGTVAWWEHELAWQDYRERYGNSQTAERIAERGGFCFLELTDHLGHEPTTWEPR